jgi:hypothetical protein
MTAEQVRLDEAREKKAPWKKWGPYLSERQWGTVREDYSEAGNAWDYFSHDQARSRAYRWGEDGLAGISDDQQRLCFALALWNGQDAILKERLFGLTNSEANHGEDVKEYYFYLDSTPTHSYMRYLYKYPQAAFPYGDLIQQNRQRGRNDFEYELLDTGIFDQNRFFDVFVEYAKGSPEDVLVQITVWNRGPEAAELHVLPTLWFRNQWSWNTAISVVGHQCVDFSWPTRPSGKWNSPLSKSNSTPSRLAVKKNIMLPSSSGRCVSFRIDEVAIIRRHSEIVSVVPSGNRIVRCLLSFMFHSFFCISSHPCELFQFLCLQAADCLSCTTSTPILYQKKKRLFRRHTENISANLQVLAKLQLFRKRRLLRQSLWHYK